MRFSLEKIKKLPQVAPTHWLKGSVDAFFASPLDFLTKARNDLGPSFRFRAGLKWFCIFTSPVEIQEIFSNPHNDTLLKEQNTAMILGQTVLTANGETWKRQRKEANKYFSKDHLNSLFLSLNKIINKRMIETVPDNNPVTISIHDFSVNLVCDLTIGLLFKVETKGDYSKLSHSVHLMTDYIRRYSSSLIKLPLWIPTKNNREFKLAHTEFENFFRELNSKTSQSGDGNLLKYLSNDPKCSEQELYNEAMTFFVAGFETTANALFWIIYCLAHNPVALKKIQDEVQILDLDSFDGLESLKKLPYTRASVTEGLRLYPVAWFRSKVAVKDTTIGGYEIHKGNIIWVCSYLTHRDESLFKDAETFRPERFLPENAKEVKPFSYVPFGGGKTFCIGKEMAMMELVMVIAHLFKSYEFDFSKTPTLNPLASITLRPKDAWNVSVRRK